MDLRSVFSVTLLLSFSMVTQADSLFIFSYTFNSVLIYPGHNTDIISGVFKGTANGNIISNLSNIKLSFNGEALPTNAAGSMYTNDGAQISFNGLENNFSFSDTLPDPFFGQNGTFFNSSNSENYGTMVSLTQGPSYSFNTLGINTTIGGYPEFNQSAWVITAAAVPIPASIWLFGSVLAGFGFHLQRRTA
ncbi:MAG: hypothetical protein M0R33_12050 [Methylomonas sp.]|jgi:hypothetical protein|uniref:hypothetical protein n=1 Tax=Methylomonas sp. TaxID=418 RepID=UPI0025F6CFF2|nr:hypothetical protein [Methylomonas sp.]MCK9607167.1 hypothetical protein [Methylomonas sp.]